jgi:hypothetical protein
VKIRHAGAELTPDAIRGRHPVFVVTPVKTGVHPIPVTWIPFSNGMTDAVRHLDARVRGHDGGKIAELFF